MNTWNGFICESFTFEEKQAYVVLPNINTNGVLALKTEYWDAFPNAIEIPLLNAGFKLCYIENNNRWGITEDLERKARFVRFVQEKYKLKDKCVPIGMSCGGLIAIKFAAAYPELVSCMYLDAPVLNYMSCPCGFGIGNSLNVDYSEILNALSLDSISELIAYRDMPLDKIPKLVEERIPAVIVAGDSDLVVPFVENGVFLKRAYEAAEIDIEVYMKPGCEHHPHGLDDPTAPLQFILRKAVYH